MGALLTHGGEWFLGVSAEQAPPAAAACYLGAGIYGLYLLVCGMRLKKLGSKASSEHLDDEEEM